jgi:hypothetical protein
MADEMTINAILKSKVIIAQINYKQKYGNDCDVMKMRKSISNRKDIKILSKELHKIHMIKLRTSKG